MQIRKLALAGIGLLAVGIIALVVADRAQRGGPGDQPQMAAAERPHFAPAELDSFLDAYNLTYRRLWTAAANAAWNAAIDISVANSDAAVAAAEALAEFTGSRQVIDRLQALRQAAGLSERQHRQLEKAWELAARRPGTIPATVRKLIQLEARQTAAWHAHRFRLEVPGRESRDVSPADLDRLLRDSRDPAVRRAIWECGQTVGVAMKDGLAELQTLRNAVARAMGYTSYFHLVSADYGLNSREMLLLMDDLHEGLLPLYEQLQAWVGHELAARYGQARAPRLLPAHWLNDRRGNRWPDVVSAADLDGNLRQVTPQWIVEQGERFYRSLGFDPLPVTFWGRSDLFPLPADANRRKSGESAIWHLDLDQDVRALLSVRNDFHWFQTVHQELGRVYYCLAYARPELPPLLRQGANRCFPPAVGALGALASTRALYLSEIGMLEPEQAPERIRWLLSQALTGPVVLLPFACGTVAHWEHDFYEGELPRHLFNERWWQYAATFQGVAPPAARGEDHCDAAALAVISEQPAWYLDRALSHVVAHQLHRYICTQILRQNVHDANYYGNSQVGIYLEALMAAGASRDWNQLLRETTGEPLSASAMLDYYEPLLAWLREQNRGRAVGWR
ncbi:MAG: M2 family metallopeptidase [Candidatus Krumholzibacteria bacterium]|nr:M2 family metallopeptidase [Candidatus Krumholzibacteria bacterium]